MTALIPYETGTLEVAMEMGIGNATSSWDASSWDYSEWASEVVGGWVDVTCDVAEITFTSGASQPDGLLTAINATTGGVELHGDQYNPWSPPWGGQLGPRVPVRMRWRHQGDASFTTAFTGVTDSWPFERSTGVAAVPIVDATGGLANLNLPTLAVPVGQGEALSDRMNRILNQAAWPTGLRQIPTDAHKTISTTFGASPWPMLQNAADTGLGLLWIKRTGEVAYLPVGQAGGWVPHYFGINLSDHHDSSHPTWVCVVDYQNSDPLVLRNAVSISRAADPAVSNDAPVAAVMTDQASVGQFGPVTYERSDLINQDDAWSATLAGAVLLDGAWPAMHPQIADLDIRFDTRVADLLLSAEVGDVIMVHDSGQTFQCAVVGWTVDMTRKGLTGSLILSDITRWVGGLWDTDTWDKGIWSI